MLFMLGEVLQLWRNIQEMPEFFCVECRYIVVGSKNIDDLQDDTRDQGNARFIDFEDVFHGDPQIAQNKYAD